MLFSESGRSGRLLVAAVVVVALAGVVLFTVLCRLNIGRDVGG